MNIDIPKVIHICWFSGEPFPVEVRACMDSWKRVLPDFRVRVWTRKDAEAIGIEYIDQALAWKKWAFAADVVRFYAVYAEGGVYMDTDIFLYSRFDDVIGRDAEFITFHERCHDGHEDFGLQAAMFMGTKGNQFCREMLDYYRIRPFLNADGTPDLLISPMRMREVAMRHGYVSEDREMSLDILTVLPTRLLKPRKRFPRAADTFGEHRVVGSWRRRPLRRRIVKKLEHIWRIIRYHSIGR